MLLGLQPAGKGSWQLFKQPPQGQGCCSPQLFALAASRAPAGDREEQNASIRRPSNEFTRFIEVRQQLPARTAVCMPAQLQAHAGGNITTAEIQVVLLFNEEDGNQTSTHQACREIGGVLWADLTSWRSALAVKVDRIR
jgi:hypothetical protein